MRHIGGRCAAPGCGPFLSRFRGDAHAFLCHPLFSVLGPEVDAPERPVFRGAADAGTNALTYGRDELSFSGPSKFLLRGFKPASLGHPARKVRRGCRRERGCFDGAAAGATGQRIISVLRVHTAPQTCSNPAAVVPVRKAAPRL